MAVIDDKQVESKSGYKKHIDEKAAQVILNIVQVSLYTYPFKSMVRELVSNSLDSIREKNMAKKILSGERKVSDYFVEKEGDLYADSHFDPTYYDLKHLNVTDQVTLTYINRPGQSRDLFTIHDTGVGLGGERLEKSFIPGYSSKRLNIDVLGSYGLGSKSALSTGVESYRVKSIYNGKEYLFDVFTDKVDCVFSRWNEDGTENKYEVFKEARDFEGKPVKIFYKDSLEANSVTIIVEVKQHNKPKIKEAVNSQLMYFKENIVFYERTEIDSQMSTFQSKVDFKANTLYEDEDIILSDSRYYNKPHFVLKGVTYGLIDFRELELNDRYGNIGIKVEMSEIDVHPSRETILYTPRTREAILAKYDRITDKVTALMKKRLASKDMIGWYRAAQGILGSTAKVVTEEDRIFNTLSGLIDRSSINPLYENGNLKSSFSSDAEKFFSPLLRYNYICLTKNWKNLQLVNKTTTDGSHFMLPVYFSKTGVNDTIKNHYISSVNKESFLLIRLSKNKHYNDKILDFFKTGVGDSEEMIKLIVEAQVADLDPNIDQKLMIKAIEKDTRKLVLILQHFSTSTNVTDYDALVVPEGYIPPSFASKTDDSADEVEYDKITIDTKTAYKSVLNLRKQNNKFIVKQLSKGVYKDWSTDNIINSNLETSVSELSAYDNLIYGEYSDERKYGFSKFLSEGLGYTSQAKEENRIMLGVNSHTNYVVGAKTVLKQLTPIATHMDDYGLIIDNDGNLTTTEDISKGLLAGIVFSGLKGYAQNGTLVSLGHIYPELVKPFEKYRGYKVVTQKDLTETKCIGLTTIAKALDAQLFIMNNPNLSQEEVDAVLTKHLSIDIVDKIKGLKIVDEEKYKSYLLLKDFVDAYGDIIRAIDFGKKDIGISIFNSYLKDNLHLLQLEHKGINVD